MLFHLLLFVLICHRKQSSGTSPNSLASSVYQCMCIRTGSSFRSAEVKFFLHGHRISPSQTTPYNPQGNGQCERYNGILWKAITLSLKIQCRPINQWENVLPDALHSMRTLFSTATDATPHEWLFHYPHRNSGDYSLPTWLTPGKVLLRHVRWLKHDSIVEKVEANPRYVHIHQNGKKKHIIIPRSHPRWSRSRTVLKYKTLTYPLKILTP